MNNENPIKLINENGAAKEYGRIPDLWHIAMRLQGEGLEQACEAVLEVWHMAHDLKACAEGQGEARIVECQPYRFPIHTSRPNDDRDGIPVGAKL